MLLNIQYGTSITHSPSLPPTCISYNLQTTSTTSSNEQQQPLRKHRRQPRQSQVHGKPNHTAVREASTNKLHAKATPNGGTEGRTVSVIKHTSAAPRHAGWSASPSSPTDRMGEDIRIWNQSNGKDTISPPTRHRTGKLGRMFYMRPSWPLRVKNWRNLPGNGTQTPPP